MLQAVDLGGGGDDVSSADYEEKLKQQQRIREELKIKKEYNRLQRALALKGKDATVATPLPLATSSGSSPKPTTVAKKPTLATKTQMTGAEAKALLRSRPSTFGRPLSKSVRGRCLVDCLLQSVSSSCFRIHCIRLM